MIYLHMHYTSECEGIIGNHFCTVLQGNLTSLKVSSLEIPNIRE